MTDGFLRYRRLFERWSEIILHYEPPEKAEKAAIPANEGKIWQSPQLVENLCWSQLSLLVFTDIAGIGKLGLANVK